MQMTNSQLASAIKRIATNINPLLKKKALIQNQIEQLEEKMRQKYLIKLASLKEQLNGLDLQQSLFENPLKELTGGYGVSDLVEFKKVSVENKEGKETFKTVCELKYPDTVVPVEPSVSNHVDESEMDAESDEIAPKSVSEEDDLEVLTPMNDTDRGFEPNSANETENAEKVEDPKPNFGLAKPNFEFPTDLSSPVNDVTNAPSNLSVEL